MAKKLSFSFLIFVLVLFNGVFQISAEFSISGFFWNTPKEEKCRNGGVPRNMNDKANCFCQGTDYYGSMCQYSCKYKLHFNPHISETCLNERCDDEFWDSCIDVRFANFNVTRRKVSTPLCAPIPEICIDNENNFFVERFVNEKIVECKNNGILRYTTPTSFCQCLGTHHYGNFCEKPCAELGFEIPETCLTKNNTCILPKSCVDLSRPNIRINRCQNGVFLHSKHFGKCSCVATGYYGEFCEKRCPVIKLLYLRNNNTSIDFPSDFPVDCIFR
jgi:hypothetical protein